MSSLIVAASLVQFALAFCLAQLRRLITPNEGAVIQQAS